MLHLGACLECADTSMTSDVGASTTYLAQSTPCLLFDLGVQQEHAVLTMHIASLTHTDGRQD